MNNFFKITLGFVVLFFVMLFINIDLAFWVIMGYLCFVAYSVISKATKKTKTVSTKPIRTNPEPMPKAEEPAKPKTIQEYLWLMDTEDIGNKFVKAYKEDLDENSDYHMTKKEILDEYFDGDKIYKYEPFSLPFKVEDRKVYSQLEDGEWTFVGNIKKRDMEKYEQSTKTELYLMPNYFKKVNDETVEADSGDSYFGLEVTIEM